MSTGRHWATEAKFNCFWWKTEGETVRVGQWEWDSESGTVRVGQWEWDSESGTVRVGQWGWDSEGETMKVKTAQKTHSSKQLTQTLGNTSIQHKEHGNWLYTSSLWTIFTVNLSYDPTTDQVCYVTRSIFKSSPDDTPLGLHAWDEVKGLLTAQQWYSRSTVIQYCSTSTYVRTCMYIYIHVRT
jgi:hypothetical protein